MPLSSKLRAEYVELINQALDAIPMLKPTDFRTAVVDLQKILGRSASEEGGSDFNPPFKNDIATAENFRVSLCEPMT